MARSKSDQQTGRLFRKASGQDELLEKSYEEELEARRGQPVECLGQTFENDEARRAHFLGKLKEGLEELHAKLGGIPFASVEDAVDQMAAIENWPMGDEPRLRELAERMRHAESSKDLLQRWKDEVGFPHGEMEDILNLSDPPYYTACPNPFLEDFVWHHARQYEPTTDNYHHEPFATDVSEGKNDPIYKAHSYHTKVPHRAIMRYVLHYTQPGDLVFDGFCGTGMTGVAAQLCGDKAAVRSLGYSLNQNDEIFDEVGEPISRLGGRSVAISDLSPIACFVAYNLNKPADRAQFEQAAQQILDEVIHECGWMFETQHLGGNEIGKINYVIWSDVLLCPECGGEFVYWEHAVDYDNRIVRDTYPCPHCAVDLSRKELERKLETLTDQDLGETIQRPVQVPVLINYSVGRHRHQKAPDTDDLDLLRNLEMKAVPYFVPTELMCFLGSDWGDLYRGYHIGTTHVHHFYTKRNRWILAAVRSRIINAPRDIRHLLMAWFTASQSRLTRLNRYMPNHGRHVGPLSGTYYMSSLPTEISPFYFLEVKLKEFREIGYLTDPKSIVSTNSATFLNIPNDTVDYIFTDPPFGDNLPYSELNFLWESWLRVYTNSKDEAIVSQHQEKPVSKYTELMETCFQEYFRVLKPGRWITVEFHNSRNVIWSAIQEALGNSGFVISDVRTLDKKKGTTKQLSYTSGAVKQDLVISAYRPNGGLEQRFSLSAGTEDAVWDFVRTHLGQLPVFVARNGQGETIAERQNFLLFDRMVAFHVQRGVTVPVSAAEFYAGLAQRFPERDSMYFLPDQVAEYDRKRMTVKEVLQLEIFVIDESSAIQWLKQQLSRKPQTFQDIHPQFLKEIGGWQKHERALELSELLEQNFLRYDGTGEVPSQIHAYLSTNFKELRNQPKDHPGLRAKAKDRWYVPDPNKAGDLEKLRERALLREFDEYRESTQKRLKVFRLEAVRAGFKRAWQDRNYETIIAVARKVPENVLQEDPKLLMWYDQALTRTEAA